jgi:hypothetical protein
MQDEIEGLFSHDTLTIVDASTVPPGTMPLSSIWSFHQIHLLLLDSIEVEIPSVPPWCSAGCQCQLLAHIYPSGKMEHCSSHIYPYHPPRL